MFGSGSKVMLKLLTGNPLLFLSVWLLVYALLLFTLSAVSEWRRHRLRRNPQTKRNDNTLIIQFPAQVSGRRVWPRREGNPTPVLIAPPDGNAEWLPGACVVNRSQGGLRLKSERPFNPGQTLRVLSRHAPNKTLWADVEVRNCRQGRDGFELGCQFIYTHPLNVVLLFG
jgi:hypothetical protein